jgi:hypothetical protein
MFQHNVWRSREPMSMAHGSSLYNNLGVLLSNDDRLTTPQLEALYAFLLFIADHVHHLRIQTLGPRGGAVSHGYYSIAL